MVSMWKKSVASSPDAWVRRKGPPAGVDLAGRRADPGGGKDPADRAGAETVAKTDQFALHAPVSPAGILAGQSQDKVA